MKDERKTKEQLLIELELQDQELRNALEQLEESRTRYSDLYDFAPVGYLTLDDKGVIKEANLTLAGQIGVERGHLIESPFQKYLLIEDADTFNHYLNNAFENKERQTCEVGLVAKGGSGLWVLLDSILAQDANGKELCRTSVVDITERVQQEREIKLLNRLYTVLSQVSQAVVRATSPEAFLEETCRVIAEEGGFVLSWIGYVEAATHRVVPAAIWGEADDYARGITVYADDRPEGRGPTGTCIREGRPSVHNDFLHSPLTLPWRHRAARFGIRASAAFPIESAGRVWGALTIYSDETGFFGDKDVKLLEKAAGDIGFALDNMERERQRRQAEEELRESEERFREVAENIKQVFWIADRDITEMLYISPAYEEIWGRTCASLYANPRSWADSIHPEDLGSVTDNLAERGSGAQTLEYRIVRPDGSIRWVLDRAFPIHNETGEIYRFAGIAEDITERKRAEEEKGKLEAQLVQAQKMEAIGTLAGGIAHDFNNILAIIMGHAEIADLNLPLDSPVKGSIAEVLKGTRRARDLVRQILTFSRKGEQELKPLQLVPLIKQAMKLLRATLPTTIEIRQETGLLQGDDVVLADPTQIHQILINLTTNAAHAMREQGGMLKVMLSSVDFGPGDPGKPDNLSPGKYLKLAVEDTGHGMDQTTTERIFEPYFTTKGPGEGTGLGLAVVHGIVKSHGGAIHVSSEPGKGTAFHVYLPRLESGDSSEAEAHTPIPGGSETILLVDDEEGLLKAVKERLEHLGYDVSATTSSPEALDLFRQQPQHFDLVITDYTMPKMTGVDLAQEIAQTRSDIPIMLCTGFSERINEDSARNMGISAFIMKPVSLRDIAEQIRKVLKSRFQLT
jgi:PAS domain S-box-containing protein